MYGLAWNAEAVVAYVTGIVFGLACASCVHPASRHPRTETEADRLPAEAPGAAGVTWIVALVSVCAITVADAIAVPEGVAWIVNGPFRIATSKVFAAGAGRPIGAVKESDVPAATEIVGVVLGAIM